VLLEDFAARPHASGASATPAGLAVFKGLKASEKHPKSPKTGVLQAKYPTDPMKYCTGSY
jgi:hypothetical protein